MNERTIYLAALGFSDPAERSKHLDQACAGNAKLRQQVDALLAADARSGEFLDVPAVQQIADNPEVTQTFRVETEDEFDLAYLTLSTKPGSLGTLRHYEVMQVLGQGGFGTVLKAFDEKLHRLVAIKVLSRQLAATSPPRKRFLREARAVAAIKHENVVQVYSVEEQPLPYIVMEFVDGATLQDKMDEAGPIEVPEVLHIGRQIAAGLAAAHCLGLIHRDIKPVNILLEKGVVQKVKITDFGLARTADDASLTQSGTITGTPLYMAPEQTKGAKLDFRADLFSLGSVLYALACGHPPFRAPTTLAVLRRVAEDTPRPLQEIIPETPDWFVAIIDKLLAKEPADRFQTAQEVADLLGLCQSKLQAGVTPKAVALGLTPAPVEPLAKAESKRKKFPVAGVAAGVVLMFTVTAVGLFFLNKIKNDSTVAVVPPTTPAVPSPLTSTDPDRKALEWLIEQQAEFGYSDSSGHHVITKGMKVELPAGEIRLNSLKLTKVEYTTDRDLERFRGLKSLDTVVLVQTDFFDAGCEHIATLPSLQKLHLNDTKITDAGLKHLAQAAKLDLLQIGGTTITDEGLQHLAGLGSLKQLLVYKTGVSETGVKKLSAALPKCKIESDYGTYDPSSTFKNSLGMEFVKVPKGTGWLGGGAGKQGETKVVIERDFYLGKYEVTQEEWKAITGQNPSHLSRSGGGKDAVKDIADADLKRFPVESVSWDDCQLFIKKLNEKAKETGWVYRLPKEAEWEYACRGGPVDKAESAFDFYFAKPTNQLRPDQANFMPDQEKGRLGLQRTCTCKVGLYQPNQMGLFDMHGNAHEWCENSHTADGATRANRGGSWSIGADGCRSAYRGTREPSYRSLRLGFRLALVPAW